MEQRRGAQRLGVQALDRSRSGSQLNEFGKILLPI